MRIPVLTYHASSVAGDDYLGNDHVALAEDLRMLLFDGWRVVPLSWVVEQRLRTANRDLTRCVAITCDDGCDLEVVDVDYPERGRQRSFLGCLEDARIAFPDSGSSFQITSFVIADPKARRLLDEKCLHSLGWMSESWWHDASRNDLFSVECHGWDHNHDILDNDAPDGMPRGGFSRSILKFAPLTKSIKLWNTSMTGYRRKNAGILPIHMAMCPSFYLSIICRKIRNAFGSRPHSERWASRWA